MEWVSVEDRLPEGIGAIIWVKRKSGEEVKCYYHQDQMGWLHSYYNFPWTHFEDKTTGTWLTDVTHWRNLKKHDLE